MKKFKIFVKENPYVLRDVNSGDKTLQDLFEEWMLFGEEDDIWESYKPSGEEEGTGEEKETEGETEDKAGDVDLLGMLKKMNLNDVQHHLAQFSTVVGSIQELVSQFKQQQTPEPPPRPEQQSPFSFWED
ncbi:spore coat protein YlbD [Salipaludibacillus keqinensis]|uniref:spore coat protein YlbD n=1 Tax=Salipaludibacillus keqinensis TaxID=2045207 RepID=UPI001304D9BF|nr:spore coat protein YlbD [Salipaludibacillus keqinensis]